MTKILAIPNSEKQLDKLINKNVDSILISIEDLSVNTNYPISLNELPKIINKIRNMNKLVFISMNKLMHNKDIPLIKKTLIRLNELDIEAVLFYDLSIFQIAKEIGFNKKLTIYQNHSNNSIYSNNYYYDLGVTYSLISSEITLKEIFEINEKSKIKLIIPVYGHIPMCYSKRYLLTSYFDYIDKNKNENYYYIKDNDDYHIVKEEKDGTSIYNSNIIDLDCEFNLMIENKIDYIMLYSEFIDEDEYLNIIDKYISIRDGKKIQKNDLHKGFAYKETIYKVGNDNEK